MYDLDQIKIDFNTASVKRIENVDDSDYFGDAYRDYISNSLLKLLNPDEGGSPTKFLEGFSGSKSAALELGSAVHQMILEKEKYFLEEVDKPSGKVGLIIDSMYRMMVEDGLDQDKALHAACIEQDYYKSSLTQNRMDSVLEKGQVYLDYLKVKTSQPGAIVLSEQQKQKLYGCLQSVKDNPLVLDLLLPNRHDIEERVLSFNEDVIVMDFTATLPSEDDDEPFDDERVLRLKAKIDNWSVDVENKILTLNDLKTTGKPINMFGGAKFKQLNAHGEEYEVFKKGSFHDYHYYRQMAMYGFMLKQYAIKEYGFDDTWTLNVNMLVVETNSPYLSHAFSVGTKWLGIGYYEFISLLKRVSYHKTYGFDKFLDIDFARLTEI